MGNFPFDLFFSSSVKWILYSFWNHNWWRVQTNWDFRGSRSSETFNFIYYALKPAKTRKIHVSKSFDDFSELDCWIRFRTRKRDLPRLLRALKLDGQTFKAVFTGEEIFMVSLHRYSTAGSYYVTMTQLFTLDYSILSRAFAIRWECACKLQTSPNRQNCILGTLPGILCGEDTNQIIRLRCGISAWYFSYCWVLWRYRVGMCSPWIRPKYKWDT